MAPDTSRWPKIASEQKSQRPRNGPETLSSALRALHGPPPQEANMAPKPKGHQCVLPSYGFAPDGPSSPCDGPQTA
eukprot:2222850-Pyramimonas_sp.AAC.1